MVITMEQLFAPGQLLITPRTQNLGLHLERYLDRHLSGDWSKALPRHKLSNEQTLRGGEGPIVSVYRTSKGWLMLITRPDKNTTTFLMESDMP